MSIAILSASQYSGSGTDSISLRAAGLLKDRLEQLKPGCSPDIIDMRLYGMQSCIMCGDCAVHPRCSRDAPFNDLLDRLRDCDELAVIVPIYAGLPSRLVIIMEKLQEMFWLRYARSADTTEITKIRRVGICAHGGQTDDFEDHYRQNIIIPLTSCCNALGMRVLNDSQEAAICFGVTGYVTTEGHQFPQSQHDMSSVSFAMNRLAVLFTEGK